KRGVFCSAGLEPGAGLHYPSSYHFVLARKGIMSDRAETDRAITTVWRLEQARLIASLTRIVRDISLAEELAQEALVAALRAWPASGVPDNPGAWLTQAGKRKAIDYFRHR